MEKQLQLNTYLKILLLIFFVFIVNPFIISAQFVECGTPDSNESSSLEVYSRSIDEDMLASFAPKVYNIFFWGINNDDGSNPTPLTEQIALQAIANINIAFNSANIFFKYKGFDHFNSSLFSTGVTLSPGPSNYVDLVDFAEYEGYKEPNSFNIYVPQDVDDFSGVALGLISNVSIVRFEALLTQVTVHEIGHNFNLKHTFKWSAASICERVTRDPTNPFYNADTRGDEVTDTAAQDEMWGDIDPNNCDYIGIGRDCANDLYQILEADARNFMGYGGLRICANSFTTGQKIRMQEAILDDELDSNEVPKNAPFIEAETTLDKLYEPYKGSYFFAGPILPEHKTLFQPGFSYYYFPCSGFYPSPSGYNDISFSYSTNPIPNTYVHFDEADFSTITHPNHSAFAIMQLSSGWPPQPRKCYNNYNRAASGGTVIKFEDGVFNTNVTITPKDSTAINNQNLVQDLDNGLYKIEKVYDDGAVKEEVILKTGN